MAGTRALDNVKVIAFEVGASGPFCSRILADMGAEVFKVERPGTGDLARKWDSNLEKTSSYHVWLNRNKRSIALDVKSESGLAIIEELVKTADVFIENFAPGVAAKLGLDFDSLSRINPALVYCSISGYGQDGPYRDVKAYDLLIQGEAGILATTGSADAPAKVGVPLCDLAAGMYGSIGILSALLQRQQTGKGNYVDISMFESVLSMLAYFPYHYLSRGEEPPRTGMKHQYVTPYGPFLAQDRQYVNLAVASDNDWLKFCTIVMEDPSLIEKKEFTTMVSRWNHRSVLEELVETRFALHPSTYWLDRLSEAGLPHGTLREMKDVLSHPQTLARQVISNLESESGPVMGFVSPLRFLDSEPRMDKVPALGEDSVEILIEAGYALSTIQEFIEDGVLGNAR